jgi:hypothetical protein
MPPKATHSLPILPEPRYQLRERLRVVSLETLVINENEIVGSIGLRRVDIFAPLLQSRHLRGHIQLLLPLRLGNDNAAVGGLDHEVRLVVRDVAVRIHIVQFEFD